MSEPPEWRRASLEGVLDLSIPPGVRASQERGFESPVGVWEGEGLSIVVDATMHADPLTTAGAPVAATARADTVDGQPARVVSYLHGDEKVVGARVEPTDPSRPGVTVIVRASPGVPADIPERIIRSITLA